MKKQAEVHMAEEDERRLYEVEFDLRNTRDFAAIAGAEVFAAALAESHRRLGARYEALGGAVTDLSRERGETDRSRVDLDLLRVRIKAIYAWCRGKVDDQLNLIDPDDELSPQEVARRARLHTRAFPISPSDFGELEVAKQHARLVASAGVLKEPQTAPELGEVGRVVAARLERAAADLHAQRELWLTESEEDSAAQRALVAARADFDAKHSFHVQLVDMLLKDNGKAHEIERRIKRRDPAYRARRDAGKSVREEPDRRDLEPDVRVVVTPVDGPSEPRDPVNEPRDPEN